MKRASRILFVLTLLVLVYQASQAQPLPPGPPGPSGGTGNIGIPIDPASWILLLGGAIMGVKQKFFGKKEVTEDNV